MAVAYLIDNGVKISERNYRCKMGEIDIIGRDGKYIVFIEVKYRRDYLQGNPEEAVGYSKRRIICRVSDYYRMCHHMGDDCFFRYDVVSVLGNEVNWIKNAFEYVHK